MSCPTCDHTMQCIYDDDNKGVGVFWCPRCGTLKVEGSDENAVHVPKLVERCRKFIPALREHATIGGTVRLATEVAQEWHRLGIAESINLPADRPQ